MSITDSTTSLDTSWTEQSVVQVTAGSLSSLSTMADEVQTKLQRGTLSSSSNPTLASVYTWLVRAKEELAQVKSFSFLRRYVYATLTEGTYRISLPPDYNGGPISVRDQNNDRNLTAWPAYMYDLKFPDPDEEDNDEPKIFCVKNLELWINPPAGGSYVLEITYSRSGAETTSNDISWLPEIERFRCCDFAVYQSFLSLHMWNEAALYKQEWITGLGLSRIADAKRKWKDLGYRAISSFEELAGRSYQPNN